MPRTKHLVVFVAFLCLLIALVSLARGVFMNRHTDDSVSVASHTLLSAPIGAYEVEVVNDTTRDEVRASLIDTLRNRLLGSEKSEITTAVTEEERAPLMPNQDVTQQENGYVSDEPRQGFVYACQTPSGELVVGEMPWTELRLNGVDHAATQSEFASGRIDGVSIERVEGARVITIQKNSLPESSHVVQLPADPQLSYASSCVSLGPVGIALDGVPIYSALTREDGDYHFSEACIEDFDETPGAYYHNESSCLFSKLYEGAPSTLLGYAFDGFGIFSSVENGQTVTTDDLDGCHGHIHAIPWDGELVSMYHYHFTEDYPYSVGCFMGTPMLEL